MTLALTLGEFRDAEAKTLFEGCFQALSKAQAWQIPYEFICQPAQLVKTTSLFELLLARIEGEAFL